MNCSLPASYVHGIFQARILEWIAFSKRSSQCRDWTRVSCIVGRCFTVWATRLNEFPDVNILKAIRGSHPSFNRYFKWSHICPTQFLLSPRHKDNQCRGLLTGTLTSATLSYVSGLVSHLLVTASMLFLCFTAAPRQEPRFRLWKFPV